MNIENFVYDGIVLIVFVLFIITVILLLYGGIICLGFAL